MAIVRRASKADPRLRWFDEARFGMFVHFGVYAQLGRGEWVMYWEKIPRQQYDKLARTFNPSRFDAREWVDLAEQAGAKYITVTAKHHDGFCLFDSDLTDFKITNTPFGRDLIGELARACRRRGMRIVLYYSQPDWHHRNFLHRPGAFKDLQTPWANIEPDWPAYQRYVEGQVRELVTRYGRIDGIWFDGMHKSEREWAGRRLYRLVKEHQPHAIVNDRARYGDVFTPERSLPEDLTGYLFEACQSISAKGWGYMKDSPQYSVPCMVESLVRMAAAGGNFLLNVGPAPDGTIPPAQAERMRRIGEWLRRNGRAIYGTQAGQLVTGSPEVLATRRGGEVFLHLLRWPASDRLVVPGLKSQPAEAETLGSGAKLATRIVDAGLELRDLPAEPPEVAVNVVRLLYRKAPRVVRPRPRRPEAKVIEAGGGEVFLPAEAAELCGLGVKGHRLRLRTPKVGPDDPAPRPCISNWQALEHSAAWRVRLPRGRRYRVVAEISCPRPYEGSRFVVQAGRARLAGEVRPTASQDDFAAIEIGKAALPAGLVRIRLQPTFMPYAYLMGDVRGLRLVPAGR